MPQGFLTQAYDGRQSPFVRFPILNHMTRAPDGSFDSSFDIRKKRKKKRYDSKTDMCLPDINRRLKIQYMEARERSRSVDHLDVHKKQLIRENLESRLAKAKETNKQNVIVDQEKIQQLEQLKRKKTEVFDVDPQQDLKDGIGDMFEHFAGDKKSMSLAQWNRLLLKGGILRESETSLSLPDAQIVFLEACESSANQQMRAPQFQKALTQLAALTWKSTQQKVERIERKEARQRVLRPGQTPPLPQTLVLLLKRNLLLGFPRLKEQDEKGERDVLESHLLDPSVISVFEAYRRPLKEIFDNYATMKKPSEADMSHFDRINPRKASPTFDFNQLVSFAFDFRILPTMLPKSMLWELYDQTSNNVSRDVPVRDLCLTVADFQIILARMAIVLHADSEEPLTVEDMVEQFILFLGSSYQQLYQKDMLKLRPRRDRRNSLTGNKSRRQSLGNGLDGRSTMSKVSRFQIGASRRKTHVMKSVKRSMKSDDAFTDDVDEQGEEDEEEEEEHEERVVFHDPRVKPFCNLQKFLDMATKEKEALSNKKDRMAAFLATKDDGGDADFRLNALYHTETHTIVPRTPPVTNIQ
eukprot:GFYU01013660.1.p1 GENE.GFYU01013660.1~~GFYU01013660.1.p1  ORF type:complete len:582 (+),score=128.45 GFYU01013660.1:444-2189(+)